MLNLTPPELISRVLILIIAFTVHEFSHAWIATRFGDPTPAMNGRLTLNPIAHLDILGSLMLLFAGFGWAKPVPVNPFAIRKNSSSGLMWVSLAGPLSNFIMAALAAIPLRFNWVPNLPSGTIFPSLYTFLAEFIFINLTLMLFNLLPVAPLDGDAVAEYFFPPAMNRVLNKIRPFGPYLLLAVVFLGPALGFDVLSWVLNPPRIDLFRILIGVYA